ncbi:MAG: LysM peptidoglycan-binding domain-containing protein [Candidatus Limnocylindrales bacterium]
MSQRDAPLPPDESPLAAVEGPIVAPGPARTDPPPSGMVAEPAATLDPAAALRLALATLPGRSPDASVCPFLRSHDRGDELAPPLGRPSPENRCVAFGAPLAQATLQQELVCLVAAHEACPRYVRGAADVRSHLPPSAGRRGDLPRLALRFAGGALVLALVVALGFGLANGGFLAGPTPTPTAAALATATISPTATPAPTQAPTASPSVTPSLGASPTPPLTATPSPRPTPTPGATGLAARWAGLPKCPAPQTCYVYTVRRGDTFFGIATYFGTNVAGLKKLNPQYANNTTIHVGEKIKIPPPPA